MFEDYDDVFDNPSEADAIVRQAQSDITNLLKNGVTETVDKARNVKKNLEDLNRKILDAELKLDHIKDEIAVEEQLADSCKMGSAPRRFIDRITREVTKGFAPEDEVYYIGCKEERTSCELCKGNKKLIAQIDGQSMEIECPECGGRGYKYEYRPQIEKRKIKGVRLKLCFESGRVCYWSTDCITLYGGRYGEDDVDGRKTTKLFKTEEEAKQELAKREALKT